MKLKEKFAELEPTAFGPWVPAFKALFSSEELEQNILSILFTTNNKKSLAITNNSVIKIEADEKTPKNLIEVVPRYKENINIVFDKILNLQLKEYFAFIINLPQNKNEYKYYFLNEEMKSGYSKIQAFKNVRKHCELVTKLMTKVGYEYYEPIGVGADKLLGYILNLEEKVPVIGNEESYIITYECSNI